MRISIAALLRWIVLLYDHRDFSPTNGPMIATPLVVTIFFGISFTLAAVANCLLLIVRNNKENPMNATNENHHPLSFTQLVLEGVLKTLSDTMVAITAGVGLG